MLNSKELCKLDLIQLPFCDFPLLYCFFSFSIATLSIFRNALFTLKTLPKVVTNSEHHSLFFPLKFPLFYWYFSFAKVPISIFGSAHWTLKAVPNVVTNSEHNHWALMHPTALPNIWEWLEHVQKKWQVFAGTRTPDTPTDQENISLPHLFHKIYSKVIPAQKYISRVWQWHLRVHPPKIYPYSISLKKYILQLWHRHYNFCVTFQGPCIKNIFLIS